VVVNTPLTSLRDYMAHVVRSTNMRCLTLDDALAGECGFLAANFYARSVFGEDALANVSIEKALGGGDESTPVTGHIRIRAKSQGMALSLGDKINSAQKLAPKSTAAAGAKLDQEATNGEAWFWWVAAFFNWFFYNRGGYIMV